jgi:hypothetical protein
LNARSGPVTRSTPAYASWTSGGIPKARANSGRRLGDWDLSRTGCWAFSTSSARQRSTSPNQKALSLALRASMARRRHSSARRRKCSTLKCFLPADGLLCPVGNSTTVSNVRRPSKVICFRTAKYYKFCGGPDRPLYALPPTPLKARLRLGLIDLDDLEGFSVPNVCIISTNRGAYVAASRRSTAAGSSRMLTTTIEPSQGRLAVGADQRWQVPDGAQASVKPGGACNFSGRRQPSYDGTSRMNREVHVRMCVQERLACSAGDKPAGAKVRRPVVRIAGWRETKTLKPIDEVALRGNYESPGRNEGKRKSGLESD